MRKILIGIVVALAFTISALPPSGNAQAADRTPWVNDESYPSGGFYLDMASCQVWTADSGWHPHAPSNPLWVNYPYGTWESGGGFYWDPVSCQVWTADSGWHVFNPAGIWPSQPAPAPTAPQDPCARTIARGETVHVKPGCFVTGDIKVSRSSNGPWEDLKFDDNPKTGTLVMLTNPMWVHAAYGGASVQVFGQLEEAIHAMRASGCEKQTGCDWINVTTR